MQGGRRSSGERSSSPEAVHHSLVVDSVKTVRWEVNELDLTYCYDGCNHYQVGK